MINISLSTKKSQEIKNMYSDIFFKKTYLSAAIISIVANE